MQILPLSSLLVLLTGLLIVSCNPSSSTMNIETARAFAQHTLITDGHIDVPYRLMKNTGTIEDVSVRTKGGEFDFVRAKEGGLDAPFMSIYIPSRYQTSGGAKAYADELIDLVESICEKSPDKFAVAKSPDEVEAIVATGKIAFPMGMENGAGIEDDLSNLRHFFDRGIRYITMTHSKANLICDSSYDKERPWGGLSPFGEEVVAEMNKLGIMVDISHVSDETFYDILEVTKAPVIASHSSCRHFTPGWERNMDDEMIQKLAENDGVIQISFGSSFLSSECQASFDALTDHLNNWREENGLQATDSQAVAYEAAYRKENPPIYGELSKVADHIDHVVSLVGIDHVGLGSDFDGVSGKLPEGLKDVSGYPNLILELSHRGYSESDIEKICYQNVFRVWRKVEAIAAGI